MEPRPFVRISHSHGEPEVQGQADYSRGFAGDDVGRGAYSVGWSWRGDQLDIWSRPRGFAPLFFSATQDEVIVSPHLDAILALTGNCSLDFDAISTFLQLGFFIGEDTAWKEVRSMPPSGELQWKPQVGVLQPARPQPISAIQIDRHDAAVEYARRLSSSVARLAADGREACVPLSGGRDSRHILFALMECRLVKASCLTARHFPDRSDDDLRVASTLCAAFGLDHRVCVQPLRRLPADDRRAVLTNYCADEHTWALPILDALRATPSARTYDGIGGDVLSAGLFQSHALCNAYEAGDLTAVARGLCKQWGSDDGEIYTYVHPQWRGAISASAAIRRIVRELESHLGAANPLSAFYFWNRTRREIAEYTFSMLSSVTQPVAPFLDEGVVDFLLSLPTSITIGKDFHDETISQAYPQWAAFPYEDKTSLPPQGLRSAMYFAAIAVDLGRRFISGNGTPLIQERYAAFAAVRKAVLRRPWERRWLTHTGQRLHWLHLIGKLGSGRHNALSVAA